MNRRRRPPAPRACIAGCGAVCAEPWQRLCGGCWKRLPFATRKAIAEAGQERAPHRVLELARAAAAWLAEHSPAAEAARRLGEGEESGSRTGSTSGAGSDAEMRREGAE